MEKQIYAHECKLYVAETGNCGWYDLVVRKQGTLRPASTGEKVTPLKCIFAEGGAYAGEHPEKCRTGRNYLVSQRFSASPDLALTASTA